MKRVGYAMLQVIAEDFLFDFVQRGTDSTDLGQHIYAVAVLVDHARNATHLALDPAKPSSLGLFEFLVHVL